MSDETIQSTGNCEREHDFALVVSGVPDLTEHVMDALFNAGCDDATPSMQYGLLYMEFSRSSTSFKNAILNAIRDVQNAGLGAHVLQVNECNLVTQAEIARRMGRSRQMVHQYMTGQRGPGGFPPPACHITDRAPLWQWCAVSFWASQNNLLRQEVSVKAAVIEAINNVLERRQMPSGLYEEISADLQKLGIPGEP